MSKHHVFSPKTATCCISSMSASNSENKPSSAEFCTEWGPSSGSCEGASEPGESRDQGTAGEAGFGS